MKQLVCEMCGGTDLIKQDGAFVCQNCGCKYSVEEVKKMMIEGTVDVSGSTVKVDNSSKLENLYILARRAKSNGDSQSAARYYEEIALQEPNSWEAQFYKTYFKCMQTKIANMGSACYNLANVLDDVVALVDANAKSEDEKKANFAEIRDTTGNYAILVSRNLMDHAKGYSDANASVKFIKSHMDGFLFLNFKLGAICEIRDDKETAVSCYKFAMSLASRFADENTVNTLVERIKNIEPEYTYTKPSSGGCYVATAVYGSYDCPEVWTLRRFRDNTLAETWYGRAFIHTYYAISPTLVKMFGHTKWFKNMWKGKLDNLVLKLQSEGVESTPYEDKEW